MTVAFQRAWTRQQFLDRAEAQEERYEFDGFRPVAVTDGNANHGTIIGDILFALIGRLGNGPCRALGPDAGVETAGEAVRFPDVLVTCTPHKGTDRVIPGVVIVFEVISPTSGRNDRIVKPREYATVPSILRYVIVEFTTVGLTVFSRTAADHPWLSRRPPQLISSCQVRPSRSISAIAEVGPHDPAGYSRGLSRVSSHASMIGSTHVQAASTSSRRMNNVGFPRTLSINNRS